MNSTENYWIRKGRIGRRGLLGSGIAAGAGLAGLALTGCGDDDDDTPATATKPAGSATAAASAAASPAAGSPKKGGVFNYPQTTSYTDVFDPHTSLSQAGVFFALIGNIAFRPSNDATKLEPELVEKWEIPGDGTELVFTIRPNVVWQNKPPTNGRAFTTDDLAFNLTRITGKLNPDKIGSFQRASTLPAFESAAAVDEKTVRVKLSKPQSAFLFGMSDWRNTIIPRDFVEKGGKFEDATTLVGTGAWQIESFQNQAKAVFKPNPTSWEKDRPYLDQQNWVFFGDTLSSQAAFGKGDIDFIAGGNKVINDTLAKLAPKARQENWVFGNWTHLRFNTTKKPFDDPRLRLAFFHVFNYKLWADDLYGAGLWDFTGPLAAAFTESIPSAEIAKTPGYDPDKKAESLKTAKDLLTAAGYPDGKGLAFKIMPSSATDTNSIRAQGDLKQAFPQISVELDIPADTAVFARRQVAGDWDMISYTLYPAPDAVIEMTNNLHSKGARNYGKFNDPGIDALIEKAGTQLDARARADTLKEAQKTVIEKHMPTVHVAMPRLVAYIQPRIAGMEKYGGRIGGGNYDTQRAIRNAWIV